VRIALIAPPWLPVPPIGYGGTEAVIDRLARGFEAAGHEVRLFTTGDSTCPVPRAAVLEHAVGMGSAGVASELRHVIRAYDQTEGFDIVHDHTLAGPLIADRVARAPVVTTNHGPFDDEVRDLYRLIAGRVPIVAISRAQAATARDIPIARVIHHGIDPDQFPLGAGTGGYCLFVGRMAPEKGVARAAAVAHAAGVRLLIAAKMREPGERRYFEEAVQPLLDDRVTYVGEVGGREKLELFAGARALLNPIRWPEPFGLVMIEALACGTPVLSFREGAAPEIVEPGVTGFLCDDEPDMVARLEEVGDLDRRACRAAVEGWFSADRMVAEHLDLYERVVGREVAAA